MSTYRANSTWPEVTRSHWFCSIETPVTLVRSELLCIRWTHAATVKRNILFQVNFSNEFDCNGLQLNCQTQNRLFDVVCPVRCQFKIWVYKTLANIFVSVFEWFLTLDFESLRLHSFHLQPTTPTPFPAFHHHHHHLLGRVDFRWGRTVINYIQLDVIGKCIVIYLFQKRRRRKRIFHQRQQKQAPCTHIHNIILIKSKQIGLKLRWVEAADQI